MAMYFWIGFFTTLGALTAFFSWITFFRLLDLIAKKKPKGE